MNEIITEKNYPIQKSWVIENFISTGIIILLMFIYAWARLSTDPLMKDDESIHILFYLGIICWGIIHISILVIRRNFFHYSLEDKFMVLRQGIISRQERNIPYGVIQNIFVKQGLLDRIFGLASLAIENASSGAGASSAPQMKSFSLSASYSRKQPEAMGFSGNKVSIPGLSKNDAETLKEIVLQKMKENPVEDSQSGL